MDAVQEARLKLADKFGESTRIGGKGVARRKVIKPIFLIYRSKKSPKARSLMIIS